MAFAYIMRVSRQALRIVRKPSVWNMLVTSFLLSFANLSPRTVVLILGCFNPNFR